MERTLAIIKPDAVGAGLAGKILACYEEAGFRIAAVKMVHLCRERAEMFYEVHHERPFYGELCEFMSSGPCIALVLEADNVIKRNRELMGDTDPAKAAAGTIRKRYAKNKQNNAVHGSDAPDTAQTEIKFFFSALEIMS